MHINRWFMLSFFLDTELSNDNMMAMFREYHPSSQDQQSIGKDRKRALDSIKGIKNQLSRRLSNRNLIHIS